MNHQPDERARLAIFVQDVPCAEVLAFRSREAAIDAREEIFEQMQGEHAMVTVADDFGTEITVPIDSIRLIRLAGDAP